MIKIIDRIEKVENPIDKGYLKKLLNDHGSIRSIDHLIDVALATVGLYPATIKTLKR